MSRRRWSRWFAVATVPGAWALVVWIFIIIQNQGSSWMRGFQVVPFGLGVCASVFLLQLADALAWRLTAARREPVFALGASLSLLLCASVVLLFLGRIA